MEADFNPRYYTTVDQIYHSSWAIRKLGRVAWMSRAIATLWPGGHPTTMVHVAGTSGKGSTCCFLERGFAQVGTSGAFLSPHVFDYAERFVLNGAPAPHAAINAVWEEVVCPFLTRQTLESMHAPPSFHETNILIALALFERFGIERAAIEASLGGRYDETTALPVVATALTNVGHDHEHLLGAELWQRALDKVGILRPGVPFFTSDQHPVVVRIVTEMCEQLGAPLHHITAPNHPQLSETAPHQRWNEALALALLRHLFPAVDESQFLEAFCGVRLPARFWEVEPGIYADIAHNPDKIAALAAALVQRFPQQQMIVVAGLARHRDPATMLRPLFPLARLLILCQSSFKGQDVAAIHAQIATTDAAPPLLVIADPSHALAAARAQQLPNEPILITGSTYVIDQALNRDPYLRSLNGTYGWRFGGYHP